ncbi:hypothetical protein PIB30_088265, partial [Stylosanthes scabra]|nr:hypothetical protein [Stylosanthes scabra]
PTEGVSSLGLQQNGDEDDRGLSGSGDSEDGEYLPSDCEIDSANDVHFTDNEEDLDLGDSFFGFDTHDGDNNAADKGKKVVNEEFSNDDGDSS